MDHRPFKRFQPRIVIFKHIGDLLQRNVRTADDTMRHFPVIVAASSFCKTKKQKRFFFLPVWKRLFLLDEFGSDRLAEMGAGGHDGAAIALRHIGHHAVHVEQNAAKIARQSTPKGLTFSSSTRTRQQTRYCTTFFV